MDSPAVSVVVPTRNRADSLARCLSALRLAAADLDVPLEVVVADDASTDHTRDVLARFPEVRAVPREVEGGASAARNSALRVASAPLILFLDDDIEVERDLIRRHLEHHGAHPEAEAALTGLVTWTRTAPISRHMRWLERGGPLFAFDTIADPDDVEPVHFCTANSSVKAAMLDRVDGPFDERLRRFTDVDLGLRLSGAGMRLRFDADAVAWHLRSDTPSSTDDRMRAVGRASVMLDAIHPGVAPPAAPLTAVRRAKLIVARLLGPLAPVLPESVADRIWSARAAWAYAAGRREAGA